MWVCEHECKHLWRPEEGSVASWARVTDCREPLIQDAGEQNLGPLQEWQGLLTDDPSLQSLRFSDWYYVLAFKTAFYLLVTFLK